MATKAEDILARIQALGYATDTEAAQLLALNAAHKRVLNTRRWRFLMSTDVSKSTSIGDGTIVLGTLPETKRIDAVRLESGTERFALEYVEPEVIRDYEHQYRDNGVPEFWSVIGNELHVWPIPDRAYTIVLDLILKPNEITAKANEVQIPDSHADILVWDAIMSITYRERDWDAHNFARQRYAELLAEMLVQFGMSNRQTSGRVVESGFFDKFDVESGWLI